MKLSSLSISLWAAICGITASACSQGPVSIGDQQGAQTKTGLAAFAANWDGYVQVYKFSDDSDRVRVVINEDGTGTIRFGEDELLPVPTDPNAKFPPDFPTCSDCSLADPLPDVWNGFLFPLKGIRVSNARLQASAASREIFADWCGLQTPHEFTDQANPWNCSRCSGGRSSNGGLISDMCVVAGENICSNLVGAVTTGAPSDNDWTTGLCERELLCDGAIFDSASYGKICVCDAYGCGIGSPVQNIQLDGALQDNQQTLTATLALPVRTTYSVDETTNFTVVLKRQ